MKATVLRDKIDILIKKHGDCEVYSGGESYPGAVCSIRFMFEGDPYHPKGSFTINAADVI